MNDSLIKAITNLTSQSNSDALTLAFLRALSDTFNINESTIYILFKSSTHIEITQSLSSCINSSSITEDSSEITLNASMNECIRTSNMIIDDEDLTTCLTILIMIDNKPYQLLSLIGNKEIIESVNLIHQFVKIYENLLTIFLESETDKLTNLLNRRTFDIKINKMLLTQKNKKEQLSLDKKPNENRNIIPASPAWLAILDIDFFKNVNDQYGHIAGDEVLLRLSQIMQNCLRKSDLLFRFGGEEFVVILEPTSFEMANATLERFRKMVSNYQFPLVKSITISIGFAKITENDYPATIIDYADKALYYAKDHGRNCVYNYDTLFEQGILDNPSSLGEIDIF